MSTLAAVLSRRFWTRSVRVPAPASWGVIRLGVAPGILGIVSSRWGGLFTGWGYDADAPLRPWPARFRGVTPRGSPVAGWAWCGFFIQRAFPRGWPYGTGKSTARVAEKTEATGVAQVSEGVPGAQEGAGIRGDSHQRNPVDSWRSP